jgi:hypothetical protein
VHQKKKNLKQKKWTGDVVKEVEALTWLASSSPESLQTKLSQKKDWVPAVKELFTVMNSAWSTVTLGGGLAEWLKG